MNSVWLYLILQTSTIWYLWSIPYLYTYLQKWKMIIIMDKVSLYDILKIVWKPIIRYTQKLNKYWLYPISQTSTIWYFWSIPYPYTYLQKCKMIIIMDKVSLCDILKIVWKSMIRYTQKLNSCWLYPISNIWYL